MHNQIIPEQLARTYSTLE